MKKITTIILIILIKMSYSQASLTIDSITYAQPSSPTSCDGHIYPNVSGGCPPYTSDFHDPFWNASAVVFIHFQ